MLMSSLRFTGFSLMGGILAAYFIRVLAERQGPPLYAVR